MPAPAAAPAAAPITDSAIVDVTALPATTATVATVSAIVIINGDFRVSLCSGTSSPGSAIKNCLH